MKPQARATKESYIQQARSQYKWQPLDIALQVEITLYFPDHRRRDRDNRHKISMDSMEWIVYLDDKQIEQALVRKRIDKKNPRIEFIFEEI